MNKKRMIGIVIVILFIIFGVILAFLININDGNDNINNNKEETSNISTNSENISNTTSNHIINYDYEENNEEDDDETYEEENYVFYHEDETGEASDSQEQIENLEFEINFPDEIKEKIDNIDEINTCLKEYIYKHGLVSATKAKVEEYSIKPDTNILSMILVLNDDDENKLMVIVNLDTGNVVINNY